jgi:hypothetical protein
VVRGLLGSTTFESLRKRCWRRAYGVFAGRPSSRSFRTRKDEGPLPERPSGSQTRIGQGLEPSSPFPGRAGSQPSPTGSGGHDRVR